MVDLGEKILLMFAYHFPPENAIGGMRPYRFAKYLSRAGVRYHTVTAADVSSRPDLHAETVVDPFIARPREGLGWQAERAVRKFLMPGASGSQWAIKAYKAACRYLDEQTNQKQSIVFSTYPPLGTPLAGYWLKKRRNIPWILDFRDPLGDNPADSLLTGPQKDLYRFLEKTFIAAADCVIANTDAAQERLCNTYPAMASKIHLIWNGFDPEKRLNPLPTGNRKQRIYSHVGELYEGRVITPLLHSIGRLIGSGKLSPSEILIQLIGTARPGSIPNPEFVAEATERGWLKLTEHVPQEQAQRIIQESDGLLLVQPHSTLQVPGKLFEYVQIGRPVLAFIMPNTPIERILTQSRVPSAFAYTGASEERIDEAVLQFFHLDTQAVQPSAWFEDSFNGQHQASQLLAIMNSLGQTASVGQPVEASSLST